MSYFTQFPIETFEFDGEKYELEDVTRRVHFLSNPFVNYSYINEVFIDDDRPDVVSYELYENPNYWWTFFVINNITINDWPLTDEELEDKMTKYTEFQLNSPVEYETDGVQVPRFSFKRFVADGVTCFHQFNPDAALNPLIRMSRTNSEPVTLREKLQRENDSRKRIRAVKRDFIGQFFNDFRSRIKSKIDLA